MESDKVKILKGIGLGLLGFFLFIGLPCFGLVLTLNSTIFNPDFALKEIQGVDINETLREVVKSQLPSDVQNYASAIFDTLEQERPWIDEQIHNIVLDSYDFLRGNSGMLKLSISFNEIKQILTDNLVAAIIKSPPPEYQILSPQEQDLFILDLKKQIEEAMPANYVLEVNRDLIGQENMNLLQYAREIFKFFRTTFWILAGIIVLMLVLIILIEKKVRGILRILGIIFILDGILCGITYLIAKYVIPLYLPTEEITSQIHNWLTRLINDILSPFGWFSLVVLLLGGICLIMSFFIHTKIILTG
jgi:hypothetical protein